MKEEQTQLSSLHKAAQAPSNKSRYIGIGRRLSLNLSTYLLYLIHSLYLSQPLQNETQERERECIKRGSPTAIRKPARALLSWSECLERTKTKENLASICAIVEWGNSEYIMRRVHSIIASILRAACAAGLLLRGLNVPKEISVNMIDQNTHHYYAQR